MIEALATWLSFLLSLYQASSSGTIREYMKRARYISKVVLIALVILMFGLIVYNGMPISYYLGYISLLMIILIAVLNVNTTSLFVHHNKRNVLMVIYIIITSYYLFHNVLTTNIIPLYKGIFFVAINPLVYPLMYLSLDKKVKGILGLYIICGFMVILFLNPKLSFNTFLVYTVLTISLFLFTVHKLSCNCNNDDIVNDIVEHLTFIINSLVLSQVIYAEGVYIIPYTRYIEFNMGFVEYIVSLLRYVSQYAPTWVNHLIIAVIVYIVYRLIIPILGGLTPLYSFLYSIPHQGVYNQLISIITTTNYSCNCYNMQKFCIQYHKNIDYVLGRTLIDIETGEKRYFRLQSLSDVGPCDKPKYICYDYLHIMGIPKYLIQKSIHGFFDVYKLNPIGWAILKLYFKFFSKF